MPTSGLPSTIVALISIGALAASATWLQVRSWLRFMARPSRTRSPQRRAGLLAEAQGGQRRPREAQQLRRPLDALDHVGADHPLRRAVDGAVVTTVSVTGVAR